LSEERPGSSHTSDLGPMRISVAWIVRPGDSHPSLELPRRSHISRAETMPGSLYLLSEAECPVTQLGKKDICRGLMTYTSNLCELRSTPLPAKLNLKCVPALNPKQGKRKLQSKSQEYVGPTFLDFSGTAPSGAPRLFLATSWWAGSAMDAAWLPTRC